MVRLDATNLHLLASLQRDARATVIDLARSVGRAESSVRERLQALERDRFILGYHARLDLARLGWPVQAVVHADPDGHAPGELAARLAAMPEVTSAVLATGPRAVVIKLAARDLASIERTVDARIGPLLRGAPDVAIVLQPLVAPRQPPVPLSLPLAAAPGA